MRLRILLTSLIIFVCLVSPPFSVAQQSEGGKSSVTAQAYYPFSFMGLRAGDSRAALLQSLEAHFSEGNIRLVRPTSRQATPAETCSQMLSSSTSKCIIIGLVIVDITVSIIYSFFEDRLESIYMSMNKSASSKFLAMLIDKYGEPMSRTRQEYNNKMGATFYGEAFSWGFSDGYLSFDEISGKVDQSVFLFTSKEESSRRQLEKNKSLEKAKKVL